MTAKNLKVIVVDDEALARRRLVRFVRSEPDVESVTACSNGPEAIEAIRSLRPDIVFLDVQMPEIDGFEVLGAIPADERPLVVFVTAFGEYAVRAFEIHALDYLLKPFGAERFHEAFGRARAEAARRSDHQKRLAGYIDERASRTTANGSNGTPRWLDRIMIKTGGRVFFVKAHELDWIEAADNYVRLHRNQDVYLIRETLSALESRLDPSQFARIHRSTIVNLDRVTEMHQAVSRGYVAVLGNGTRLKVSPWYRERLEERMRTAP
jgi:two-component system, LytTR family, response regulator